MNQAETLQLPLKFEIQDVLPNYIGPFSCCWLETNHPKCKLLSIHWKTTTSVACLLFKLFEG